MQHQPVWKLVAPPSSIQTFEIKNMISVMQGYIREHSMPEPSRSLWRKLKCKITVFHGHVPHREIMQHSTIVISLSDVLLQVL